MLPSIWLWQIVIPRNIHPFQRTPCCVYVICNFELLLDSQLDSNIDKVSYVEDAKGNSPHKWQRRRIIQFPLEFKAQRGEGQEQEE